MKLYRATGTYYEKQADVPKGTKFETVEFPFAASPKADFVGWLNGGGKVAPEKRQPTLLPEPGEDEDRYRVFFKGNFAGVLYGTSPGDVLKKAPDHLEARRVLA